MSHSSSGFSLPETLTSHSTGLQGPGLLAPSLRARALQAGLRDTFSPDSFCGSRGGDASEKVEAQALCGTRPSGHVLFLEP